MSLRKDISRDAISVNQLLRVKPVRARSKMIGRREVKSGLESFGLAEGADDYCGVLMLGVDGEVEASDVGGGEFAGEIGEGGAKLGESGECGLADDGDGVVWREVMAIVFEGDEAEGDEAEIHHFGRFGEMEIVAIAPTAEAVGALEEFVADAGAPFTGDGSDIGDFLQMEIFGVVAADDHGESVFKTEGLGDFEMKAIGVELLDAAVDGG